MSLHVSTSKEIALCAVGRTLVIFQRLEHNLKRAARLGPVEGTLAKIERDIERRVECADKFTLGNAIQAWLDAAHSELPETGHTADLFDATMQMTVSLVPDAEVRGAHGAALKSLLETRNKLVHGGLVDMQWESPSECARLIGELDGVNEEIRVQMEFITSSLRGLSILASLRQEDWELVMREPSRQEEAKAVRDA
jgi:DNA-binding FrmR family transcriptional regulator